MRVAIAAILLAAATMAAGPSRPAAAKARLCVHSAGDVARYCGPAEARVSAFPGVLFRKGSCTQSRTGGVPLLQVHIGAKSLVSSRTNGGLTLFTLQLTGPLSHPTSGLVLAYFKSSYWQGRSTSFRGNARAGTFRAEGVFPSRGHATGSFRCY
ncbi:MAG: hypothetical protein H0U00_08340 [Actinobacteria bacterium]|nr:hypothetical protein [Actinomycetota bacterium]